MDDNLQCPVCQSEDIEDATGGAVMDDTYIFRCRDCGQIWRIDPNEQRSAADQVK